MTMWYKKWQWKSHDPIREKNGGFLKKDSCSCNFLVSFSFYILFFLCPKRLFTWIIGSKSQYNVAIVWNGNCVLEWWQIVLSVKQSPTIQVQGMLQIDLFDIGVRRSANANDIETITMKMEGMAKIWLLNYLWGKNVVWELMDSVYKTIMNQEYPDFLCTYLHQREQFQQWRHVEYQFYVCTYNLVRSPLDDYRHYKTVRD